MCSYLLVSPYVSAIYIVGWPIGRVVCIGRRRVGSTSEVAAGLWAHLSSLLVRLPDINQALLCQIPTYNSTQFYTILHPDARLETQALLSDTNLQFYTIEVQPMHQKSAFSPTMFISWIFWQQLCPNYLTRTRSQQQHWQISDSSNSCLGICFVLIEFDKFWIRTRNKSK